MDIESIIYKQSLKDLGFEYVHTLSKTFSISFSFDRANSVYVVL